MSRLSAKTTPRLLLMLALLTMMACVPLPTRSSTTPHFYVNNSGSDTNPGSEAQPWRTLARVQAALSAQEIPPGSTILLARDQQFEGDLHFEQAPSSITITAYGSGAMPIISGMRTISNWQSVGQHMWRAACTHCQATPTTLLIDDQPQAIARWPNADAPNRGYRFYTSFSGRTRITDPDLPSTIDWSGGELVLRSIAWVIDRLPIATHSGSTITTSIPATYDIAPGYGYFIQNHPQAIDRFGEWSYNASDATITLMWPNNPGLSQITTPLDRALIHIHNQGSLTIRDLQLDGSQTNLIDASNCQSLSIEGNILRFAGDRAIALTNCPNSQIIKNSIQESANNGMVIEQCGSCVFRQNRIKNIGIVAGMGRNGDGQYIGVEASGSPGAPILIEENQIDGIGYIGLRANNAATIRNNLIRDYNRVKIDGSGIYTYQQQAITISGNYVLDAAGNPAGTPWSSSATNGIYIDDNSEHILLSNNTIARVNGAGIYLHNTRNVTVTQNLIADVGEAGLLLIDDDLGSYALEQSYITENSIIVHGHPVIHVGSTLNNAVLSTIGTIDRNRYCDPFGPAIFRFEQPGQQSSYGEAAWRSATGLDQSSQICPQRYPSRAVAGTAGPNLISNGDFDNDLAGWFGWPEGTLDARWETGRLDGGSLWLGYAGPEPTIHFDHPIGAIIEGQTYQLQFTSIAIIGEPQLQVYLRQADPPYQRLSQTLTISTNSTASQQQLFVDAIASDVNALLILELNQPGTAIGIDTVQLTQVVAAPYQLDDVTLLLLNRGTLPTTIQLESDYQTLTGERYPAGTEQTLDPWQSIILLRDRPLGAWRAHLPHIRR